MERQFPMTTSTPFTISIILDRGLK